MIVKSITDKLYRTVNAKSGLCSSYCGWHYYYKTGPKTKTTNIPFAYIGSPLNCSDLGKCSILSPDSKDSPNGDYEMDSMISTIAHEIAETAADPNTDCWIDRKDQENADFCQGVYGTRMYDGPRLYNEVVGSEKYLIQTNWDIGSSPQRCRNGY